MNDSPAPRVEVHDDAAALATAVAGELLSRLADAQDAGREPHVVLTGGTIAVEVHREIARRSPGSGVDWSRVVVWWGDERFVSADSEDRNARGARADLLDAVGATRVHEMPAVGDVADVDAAAQAYAAALREHAAEQFEVVMLGVGPDGHVASLFPGFAQLDAEGLAVAVTDSPKPPPERVSLTYDRLNHTRATWLLVSGEGKADAVAAALAPEPDDAEARDALRRETPARGVAGREETVWFLDRASASAL